MVRFPSARSTSEVARKILAQKEREILSRKKAAIKKNLPNELLEVKRLILSQRQEGRFVANYQPPAYMIDSAKMAISREITARLQRRGYDVSIDSDGWLTIRWGK